MSFGTNRDYKSRSKSIPLNLQAHKIYMDWLIEQGHSKADASEEAFRHISKMTIAAKRRFVDNHGRKNPTRRNSTSTSSDVRSPTRTATSTEAHTSDNITVTGGAGKGATTKVTIVRKANGYLQTFFAEKHLPYAIWDIKDKNGVTHVIDGNAVIEAILHAPKHEQTAISNMLRKIDFHNGDVNHYLKHLAGGLVNNYKGVFSNPYKGATSRANGAKVAANPNNQTFRKYDLQELKELVGDELALTKNSHIYNELKQFPKVFGFKVYAFQKGKIGKNVTAYRKWLSKDITSTRRNATASDFRKHQSNRLQELSKLFQGHANGDKHKLLESDYTPKQKYRLGHLVLIKIKSGGKVIPIEFGGDAMLSADLKNNLWVCGKDAIISNITKPKEGQLKYLGEVTQIDYVTAKSHIEGGKTVRYFHKLGEVTNEKPNLFIDSDGFPLFVGGNYDVWSVGVVN